MRYATLCTGIGGFDLGFDRAGMECVYQCEYDAKARGVLRAHWPDAELGNDVNDAETENALCRHRPDLVAFGFPCQDLSVAGRRAGLAGERSGLFFRCMYLVSRCRARWVVIENVPGLLSSDGGRDMGAVVGTLAECGYRWAYRVLDAQFYGVAQRRRRVFIVGHLGDGADPAEILFDAACLPGDPPPRREAGARTAGGVAASLNSGGNNGGFRTEPGEHLISHTLKAEGHDASEDGTGRGVPNVPARVAATECGNTRGNIEVATACNHHGGRQDFDSETFIAYGLELSNQGSGRNVGWYPASAPSRTLDTNGPPGVMGPQPLYYSHDYNQDRIYSPDGPAPAVTSQDSNGSRNVLAAMQVRRLTPMECERLQGFPDQWTRWDADGKEQSDSARYRQLGNAVCVPVAEWIGRRIMERP